MTSRTNTVCKDCIHNKICARLGRPEHIVEALGHFNVADDNGIDILVTCDEYRKNVPEKRKDTLEVMRMFGEQVN